MLNFLDLTAPPNMVEESRAEIFDMARGDEELEESSEDSSHVWTSEESDAEDSEDQPEEQDISMAECLEDEQFLSKGAQRHVRAANKSIADAMLGEVENKKQLCKLHRRHTKQVERPLKALFPERRPRPWRFCEISTWTCMMTITTGQLDWGVYPSVTWMGAEGCS